MKKKSIQLSIPEPCSESWEEMSPVQNGRYCDRCSKTVTDFTHLSDEQLIQFLSSNNGNVCGRMRNDQLNRSLIQEIKSDQRSLRPIAAGIAFLLSFSMLRSQNITEKPMHILKTNAVSYLNRGISGSNDPGFIHGLVQDSISNEPVNGVSIVIRNTSFSCTSDSTGRFFLELPASFDADSIQLDLSCDGYASKSITLSTYAPMYAMLDPVTIGEDRESVTVGALIRTPFHEISVRKFRFSRLLHPFRRFRKKKHLS